MRARVLAASAAVWTAGYLLAYLGVICAQGGQVPWWYVAVVIVAAASLTVVAGGRRARTALTVALLASVVAMVVGLFSLGVLLAPAVAVSAIALSISLQRAHSSRVSEKA